MAISEIVADVNWIGVVVGAVTSFLLGWLWYSPMLFGVKWAEGVGVKMNTADQMPVGAMVWQFVGLFLMSWFVGVTAVNNALLTVVLATVAFVALAYSGGMFTKKSAYARLVDAGYWLACLVVMIVCQGVFRSISG